MNYDVILAELEAEMYALRNRITQIRKAIDALKSTQRRKSTRGRKSMPPAERLEVSARMKRYWAGRRKARAAGTR